MVHLIEHLSRIVVPLFQRKAKQYKSKANVDFKEGLFRLLLGKMCISRGMIVYH